MSKRVDPNTLVRAEFKARAMVAALDVASRFVLALSLLTPLLLFAAFFWMLSALGLWEAPTPENIRKLEAELSAGDVGD